MAQQQRGISKIRRSTSRALYVWLVTVLVISTYPSDFFPDILIEFSDLMVHFILYAVTGALFYVVFKESSFGFLNKHPALLAVSLAALYGFGMEVAQFYIPTRSFSLADSAANALGAAVAVSILVYLTRRTRGTGNTGNTRYKGPAGTGGE